MELTLKLLTGRSAGKDIKITTAKFLIGRADDCHLRPHSDLVSRHHCAVLVQEGVCAIQDFGSRNGTFVNGEKVVGQHELRNGDRLKVGVLEFEVQLTSSVGGKKRPKVKDVKDAAQRTASGSDRGGAEEDVSDWLSIEEDSDTKRIDVHGLQTQPHETPAPNLSNRETTFIKKPEETTTIRPIPQVEKKPVEPAKPPVAKEPAAAEPVVENRGVETANRLFGGKGKFAGKPGNAPKDSREAAADALKRLFNTRKP